MCVLWMILAWSLLNTYYVSVQMYDWLLNFAGEMGQNLSHVCNCFS